MDGIKDLCSPRALRVWGKPTFSPGLAVCWAAAAPESLAGGQ